MVDVARARFGQNPLDSPDRGGLPNDPASTEKGKRQLLTAIIGLAQAGSFNLADKVGAATAGGWGFLHGKPFTEGYHTYEDWALGNEDRAMAENPEAYQLGSLLGFFTPGGVAKVGGVEKLLPMLRSIKPAVRAAGRALEGGAYGAGYNALASFNMGEGDFSERLARVPEAATVGALYTAAGTGVGVLSNLARKVLAKYGRISEVPASLRWVFAPSEERQAAGLPAHVHRDRSEASPPPAGVPPQVKHAAELENAGFQPDQIARLTGLQRHPDDGIWRPTLPGSLAQ